MRKGYGVPKGSKRTTIHEEILPRDRPTLHEAQELYQEYEDRRRRLSRAAARFVNVNGIQPGDTLPPELVKMRTEIRQLDREMKRLADIYPRVA